MTDSDTYLTLAYRRGSTAAYAAGTWTEIPDPPHTAESMIEWIEIGHPSVDGYLPTRPDLSAEWGGSETPTSLMLAIGINHQKEANEMCDAICEAWERGVNDHFYEACAKELRRKSERRVTA